MPNTVISQEFIEKKIYIIRGQKVMLDKDLAELYGVPTKRLNQQAGRNIERFPSDFMFQLNSEETRNLRLQNVTSSYGGTRYLPYVFTEQGVAMLSGVLTSPRAVEVNIAIMRAFVRLRVIISAHKDLAEKLKELEMKIGKHDKEIIAIFEVIKRLAEPLTDGQKRRIGFHGEVVTNCDQLG